MDTVHNIALGFGVALTLQNVAYAFFGSVLGTLIGVLPGLGPVATIAMLLPSIYALDATPALIMLAGIYYGAQYSGSTSSILINVPGESSSAVTCIDGHQLARQGRAGAALSASALGSFFAGCVGTVIIAACAPMLIALAFRFGAAEYFSLMVLCLIGSAVLASGSLAKAVAMILIGLLLGEVDKDMISGVARYGFEIPKLTDGIGFVGIAIGVFGFGEIIANLGMPTPRREVFTKDVKRLWPTRHDFGNAWPAVLRGTAVGSLIGVLPGGGALLSSFAAYSVEKKMPAGAGELPFGKGNIRGVAGPESANNAGVQTSFIPMLTLGIPPNVAMALMVGAMTIKGIRPGPQVMTSNPELFWGLVASMWVGNAMLLVLNLPLIGIWIKLLTVPYRLLFPAIVVFCGVGLYTLDSGAFDIYVGAGFAVVAYVFYKLGCEPAPLLLGYILGPMMEQNLRGALLLSEGDWSTFLVRPLSAGLLAAAALMVVVAMLPTVRIKRESMFIDET